MAPPTDTEFMDYYDLLSIPPTASETEIRRAYRKTSLLYHPDKVKPTPETEAKFHALSEAIKILSAPAEKAKYDQLREAKQKRKAEHAALDEKRRRMVEDLEKREAQARSEANGSPTAFNQGTKRSMSDREMAERRIAEANRQRMMEMMARKRQQAAQAAQAAEEERQRQQAAQDAERAKDISREQDSANTITTNQPSEDSYSRAIRVRWVKDGDHSDIDSSAIEEMFATVELEVVSIMKDKKRRIEGRDKKVLLGTALVMFKTASDAKEAMALGKPEGLESMEFVTTAADA